MRKRPSAPAAAGEEQNIVDGQPPRGILSTIFIELGWAVAEFALLVVGTGLLDFYVDTRNIYCVIIGTILVGGAVISGIAFVNWTINIILLLNRKHPHSWFRAARKSEWDAMLSEQGRHSNVDSTEENPAEKAGPDAENK